MNRSGQSKVIAGVDEAGRGSVIGPLVVAGIGIKESKMSVFRKLCLRDSKTLSRKSRSSLFTRIIGIADYVCVCILTTNEIDESVGLRGLNKLEAEAMAAVINDIQPDNVYVDCSRREPTKIQVAIGNIYRFQQEVQIILPSPCR